MAEQAVTVSALSFVAVSFNVNSIMCTGCTTQIEKTLRDLGASQVVADADPESKIVSFKCEKYKAHHILSNFRSQFTYKNLKIDDLKENEEPYDRANYYASLTESHSVKIYLLKAFLAGIVGIPLLILELCNMIPHPMGLTTQLLNIGIGLLTLIVMLFTSFDSFKRAWQDFKNRTAGMDTLIVLGLSITWLFSMLVCIAPHIFPMDLAHAHFSSVPIMFMVVNISHAMKMWASKKAMSAAGNKQSFIEKYQLKKVKKVKLTIDPNGIDLAKVSEDSEIDFTEILPGDYLVVPAGYAIPADGQLLGKLIDNQIDPDNPIKIDTEIKDGEKVVKEKQVGGANGKVCSGMFNCESVPIVMVAKTRATRSHVCQLFQALKQNNNNASLTDTFSKYFTPVLIGLSLIAMITWIALDPISGWAYGIPAMVNVLMCACPCALALSGPLAHYAATQRALKENIFVRNGIAFERISRTTHVVFDKTGTLTTLTLDRHQLDKDELLCLAALEQDCSHPIAEAILMANEGREKALTVHNLVIKENGRSATINGKKVAVGNRVYFENSIGGFQNTTPTLENLAEANLGKASTYIQIDNGIIKPIYFSQQIRPEINRILQFFKDLNIKISIATGDAASGVDYLASLFNIDSQNIHIKQSPENKRDLIAKLQGSGALVLMIGDGGNDSLALKKADVSISIGRSEISEYGQVILPNHLNGIPTLFDLGKKTLNNVRGNLCFTLVFNVISIVIAAGVLFPLMGVMLNPAVMCAAMLLSSLFVLISAAYLTYQLKDEEELSRRAAIAHAASLLEDLKAKLKNLNLFETALITGFVLFTALTITGLIYTSVLGMGLGHLIGMMSMPMAIAGCAGCATLLSGLVGVGLILLVAAIYIGILIYREQCKADKIQINVNVNTHLPAHSFTTSTETEHGFGGLKRTPLTYKDNFITRLLGCKPTPPNSETENRLVENTQFRASPF